MTDRIRLPDHYEARTVGTMGPDEIVYVPSHALSADYLTRNLFVDTNYSLNQRDHGEIDPLTIDDDYFTKQKLHEYIGLFSIFLATGRIYVADLRNLEANDLRWNAIEETQGEPKPTPQVPPGFDIHDYNLYVAMNSQYKPIGAAALRGVSGDVEFSGTGSALDALKYLCEENDYLLEALEHYTENNSYDIDLSPFDSSYDESDELEVNPSETAADEPSGQRDDI